MGRCMAEVRVVAGRDVFTVIPYTDAGGFGIEVCGPS